MQDKKVLISGYYGFNNFGDEGILEVLIKKLKSLNADITVFSKDPKKTSQTHKVNAIPSFSYFNLKKEIKKCDVLISGGGSLLQDATSLKSLVYYLYIINTALKLNKKVIIFAQGIGPIKSKIGQFFAKRILRQCDLVTVRDEKSLFLLRGWGIKCELVCDPLFDLALVGSNPSNKVGIQLRSFKTLNEKLLHKLAHQVIKDFARQKIEIFSFQDSLDLEVCRQFDRILHSIDPLVRTEIINNQTSKEILQRISQLDYMIAMRFHACLVALKYGIKTLGICYDEKVDKLAQEAKIPAIGMLANEDYDVLFNNLKLLKKADLLIFANSKRFDWAMFEEELA